MTLLSISDLNKSFGGVTAVKALSLDIESGAIFGIIGPNGAGKTSLFNVLTGFLTADSGSVKFCGREVLGKKPHELVALGMARSFQLVKPFVGMTALETLMLPTWGPRIRNLGRTPGEIERESNRLLDRFGLAEKGAVLVDGLNQSELRLLDIARTLAAQPEVMFLDEPFSGLSQDQIYQLIALLRELRDTGMTIVIIEHRMRELMKLVDRVMVVNFGSKLAEGTPAEIVRDPGVIEVYLGTKGRELAAAHG
jgi:branched-chain amino acid transport system ATP-binding protein